MEIKVALFEDKKKLRESLEQLINSAEGMICSGAFGDCVHLRHTHNHAAGITRNQALTRSKKF